MIPDASHLLAFNISVASRLLANCFTGSPVFSHNYILREGGDGSQSFFVLLNELKLSETSTNPKYTGREISVDASVHLILSTGPGF